MRGNSRPNAALPANVFRGSKTWQRMKLLGKGYVTTSDASSELDKRQSYQITCDYAICALPATLLRRVPMTPALPSAQHEAIASLSYGRATKSLLQFSSGFWRGPCTNSTRCSLVTLGIAPDETELELPGSIAAMSYCQP